MGSEDEDRERRRRLNDEEVRSLVTESGISESQARDLIRLLGLNRASLLREARLLKKKG